MKNIGVLLRGKSLEKFPLIKNKFQTCYIVNSWKVEIEMFKNILMDKHIIHCVNSLTNACLDNQQYKQFNIDNILFAFTKSMYKRNCNIEEYYSKKGIINFEYFDEKYKNQVLNIHNTGVACIFYVSEKIKPDIIWISGLDFYYKDYIIKKNSDYQLEKSKKIKLIDSFLHIVRTHPRIKYVLATYIEHLAKPDNLEIL